MSKFRLFCWTAALSFNVAAVHAASFSLTDNNSSITVNDRNGVTVWLVDGSPDNLFISNYYYRIGPTGNENNFLDGLSVPTVSQPVANRLALTYRGTDLQAVVNYELTGGNLGSNRSKLDKSLILTNLSTQSLDLNLFDYSDLDIRFNQLAQRDRAIALTFDRIVLDSATFPLSVLTNISPTATNYQISDFFTLYTKFFIDLDGPTTLDNTPPLGSPSPNLLVTMLSLFSGLFA
jgi:hypothetical protein